MSPVLWTLPDTPPSSTKGLAHLVIVGILVVFSLAAILVLTVARDSVPPIFDTSATIGIGYLIGVNIASNTNQDGKN